MTEPKWPLPDWMPHGRNAYAVMAYEADGTTLMDEPMVTQGSDAWETAKGAARIAHEAFDLADAPATVVIYSSEYGKGIEA